MCDCASVYGAILVPADIVFSSMISTACIVINLIPSYSDLWDQNNTVQCASLLSWSGHTSAKRVRGHGIYNRAVLSRWDCSQRMYAEDAEFWHPLFVVKGRKNIFGAHIFWSSINRRTNAHIQRIGVTLPHALWSQLVCHCIRCSEQQAA